jgi:TetR/AcrR family transcriptional regulator, ethionamide resistance regulator
VSSSVQRSRRREQRETTRREILAAAERFLRERPYRELSVDLLMAQTDLTRTAFYRHFEDVSELVLRLLEDVGSELYEVAERWQSSAGHEYPVAAHEALSAAVDFFIQHGPLVRAIAEAAATDDQIERGYRGFIEAFTEMTRQALDELVGRGQIEPLDTAALARALNLMNEAYLLAEFGREPQGDPQVVLATLETVWVRAVGPVKPAQEE